MIHKRLVRHNALISRIRSNSAMAVLYGPRRPAGTDLSTERNMRRTDEVVQASWQAYSGDAISRLPKAKAVAPMSSGGEPSLLESGFNVVPPALHSDALHLGLIEPDHSSALNRKPAPRQVAGLRPEEEDPTWRRLQAIMRLHSEKTRSHPSQSESWSEAGEQANENEVAIRPAEEGLRNTSDRTGKAATGSQTESSETMMLAHSRPSPDSQVDPNSASAGDLDVAAHAADVQDRGVEPVASTEPIQNVGSSGVHRAPLQQAWPVDRRRETEVQMAQQGILTPESDPKSIQLSSMSDDASIRRALRDVPAGHHTASLIELVLPRKARPRVAKVWAAARSLNESAESVDDSPPMPLTVAMGEEEADLMPLRVADASRTLPASPGEEQATVRDEARGLEANTTHQMVSLEASIASKADDMILSPLEADASLPSTSATLDNLSDEIAHAIESGEYSDTLSSSTDQQPLQWTHDRRVESTDIKRDEEVSPLLERVERIPLRVDAPGDPPGHAVSDAQEEVRDQEPPARIPAQRLTVDESSYDGSMVDTDIGLLPRDLWEALGEDPPRSSPNPKRSRASASDVEKARFREIHEAFEGTTQIASATALKQEPSLSGIWNTRFPTGAEDVTSPTWPTVESSVDKTPTASEERPLPYSAIANKPMQALRDDMVTALESTTDDVRNLDVVIVPSAQDGLGGWSALRNLESESESATVPLEAKVARSLIGGNPEAAAVADEKGFDPTLQLSSASRHERTATSERSSSDGDNDLADPPARSDSVGHVTMDRLEYAGGAPVKPTSVNIPAIVSSSASDSIIVQRASKRSTELSSHTEPVPASSTPTDLDVDELARQVLVEIKKRLSVERERRPSRF